jgi:hypothetical protein
VPRENRLGRRHEHGAGLDANHLVRSPPAVADTALDFDDARARPVVIGVGRFDDLDLAREGEPADPLEGRAHVRPLRRELRGITNVLPQAAAALAEERASGRDPIGAGLDDPRDAGPQRPLVLPQVRELDGISRHTAGHEDDPPRRGPRDAVPFGGERRHPKHVGGGGRGG